MSCSGIHGLPYASYSGVTDKVMGIVGTSQNGGYCMHSSTLFGTWHRPYVALFEVRLNQERKGGWSCLV